MKRPTVHISRALLIALALGVLSAPLANAWHQWLFHAQGQHASQQGPGGATVDTGSHPVECYLCQVHSKSLTLWTHPPVEQPAYRNPSVEGRPISGVDVRGLSFAYNSRAPPASSTCI